MGEKVKIKLGILVKQTRNLKIEEKLYLKMIIKILKKYSKLTDTNIENIEKFYLKKKKRLFSE